MEKYRILVKHSLPEIIEDFPAREWKLSEEGRARANRLAVRLVHFRPEIIVSSIEPKARETAEIVANRFTVPVQLVEGLHEHDRSNLPYLSDERFQLGVREFFEKPDTLVFGNESAHQVYERFSAAVHSVLNQNRNQTTVIIAHGTVISLFVSRLVGISALSLWSELGPPSFLVIERISNLLLTKENII